MVMVHVEQHATPNEVHLEGGHGGMVLNVCLGALSESHGQDAPLLEVTQSHGTEVRPLHVVDGWILGCILRGVEPLYVELNRVVSLPQDVMAALGISFDSANQVSGLAQRPLEPFFEDLNSSGFESIIKPEEEAIVVVCAERDIVEGRELELFLLWIVLPPEGMEVINFLLRHD